jgi:hypothetical protein
VVTPSSARTPHLGTIAIVVDDRLSRDRRGFLSRVIHAVRGFAKVQIIHGETTQEQLIERLKTESYALVLAPWHRYFAWSKIEAFYGLTRSSGPTFAGYFCESIQPYEVADQADQLRAILLDFVNLSASESAILIRALMKDSTRSGIRPLLDPSKSIYCENWYFGQGLGNRIDTVMTLPEIAGSEWNLRATPIRLILGALWSLIYEEGPGKSELTQATTGGKSPRAYFQLGCDGRALVFRLCYTMPSWSAKDALSNFWPNATRPTAASQLLGKYADFLRVHTINENSDVEVVVGLFNSAAAEKAHGQLHTIWIEPLSAKMVSEVPFEVPSPTAKHLKPLPSIVPPEVKSRATESAEETLRAKERFIFDSAVKIRELKRLLDERDELIRDLKAGGVGTSAPLAPPDAESLLEAFQERYFEARYQIRQFEIQIMEMEKMGATPQEVETLRLRMATLTAREQIWIRKLASTVESFRTARRGNGAGNTGTGS